MVSATSGVVSLRLSLARPEHDARCCAPALSFAQARVRKRHWWRASSASRRSRCCCPSSRCGRAPRSRARAGSRAARPRRRAGERREGEGQERRDRELERGGALARGGHCDGGLHGWDRIPVTDACKTVARFERGRREGGGRAHGASLAAAAPGRRASHRLPRRPVTVRRLRAPCFRRARRLDCRRAMREPFRIKVVEPLAARRRARSASACSRRPAQPLQGARRQRLRRPADRQRHLGDERPPVGRAHDGRRVLRGQPELLPLRGRRARHLRLPARHPHPPGPRGREPAVLDACSSRATSCPNNIHFDTTRANVEHQGAEALRPGRSTRGSTRTAMHPFKGNMDPAKLDRAHHASSGASACRS